MALDLAVAAMIVSDRPAYAKLRQIS